jgi:hypothetical protein
VGENFWELRTEVFFGNDSPFPFHRQFEPYRTNTRHAFVNESQKEEITVPVRDNSTVFVTLGHSSLKHDFGQFLVPFFDIRVVTPSIPMPLKGVGLYHRTNGNYAGFIAPRLISINPMEYVVDILNSTAIRSEEESSAEEKLDEARSGNFSKIRNLHEIV